MRSFQQKQRWRNIMESRPVLILFAVVLLVFAWSVLSFLGKMRTTRENKELAQAKVVELREKKEKLSTDIDKLNTDEGKEQIFRENFGLAKAGEGLIVIADEKDTTSLEEKDRDRGFFSFLYFWNWFD